MFITFTRLFPPGAWPTLLVVAMLAWVGAALGAEPPPLKLNTTADHAKFKELQQVFKTGPDVTRACISCHTEAARQVHRTKHWTWEFLNPENGQRLGKKYVINNVGFSVAPNYSYCTVCHVGYGWKDENFDFTAETNVDCLACHDTTGDYRKGSGLAGHPVTQVMEVPAGSGRIVQPINLGKIARKVGKSSRDTCGACHFYGGGGDGVKHGDMDSSLAAPDRELDVHMDSTGLDFTCATCHATSSHDVAGSRYVPAAVDRQDFHTRGKVDKGANPVNSSNPATCVACHDKTPHKRDERLNSHANKLACGIGHKPAKWTLPASC